LVQEHPAGFAVGAAGSERLKPGGHHLETALERLFDA